MQKNKIEIEDAMIFTKDYNGKTLYSLGVSSKKYINGQTVNEYVTAYLNVTFLNSKPESREKIDITDAWLSVYEDKEGKPQFKLIVREWHPHFDDSFEY